MTVVANSYKVERNMKLKQLQQERIEQIIREEMKNLKEGWVAADELSKSSRLNDTRLFEGDSSLEQDLSSDVVFSALEQTAVDTGNECIVKFDNEVLKHIASILKAHGLLAAGDDAGSVYEMLADFDEDSMMQAQQECVSDIATALENYVSQLSILAAGVYSGHE